MMRRHEEKTDEELMALHQAGDQDAFTTIYNRHKSDLCGFVARTLTGPWAADVEDVADVIFLELYESAERFEQGKRLIPYLYRIAEHCITDYERYNLSQKRDSRRTKSLDAPKRCRTSNGPGGEMTDVSDAYKPCQDVQTPERQSIIADEIRHLLAQLPPEEAQVIKLIRIDGHTAQSAAETLGITLNQSQWRYRQGWNRLRKIAQSALAQIAGTPA